MQSFSVDNTCWLPRKVCKYQNMAHAIKIKLENDVLAVIFVDDLNLELKRLREQMHEEVEELLPSSYRFVSKWGAPVSNVQEGKVSALNLLDSDGFLTIKYDSTSIASYERRQNNNSSTDSNCEILVQDQDASPNDQISQSKRQKSDAELEHDETILSIKKLRSTATGKVQTTLTGYFGASSKPSNERFATAATRKGVHIFSEKEIESSTGYEKERRLFWNRKSEELCRDPDYQRCSPNEIDKLLHECWRIQKADLLKREHDETRQQVEEILTKYPKLATLSQAGRKIKSETLEKNLLRVEQAKIKLQESRKELNKLHLSFQEHHTRECKNTIATKQELHQLYYRELSKAEDCFRQTLDIKKSSLKKMMSNTQ
jgi:hypothetical protein